MFKNKKHQKRTLEEDDEIEDEENGTALLDDNCINRKEILSKVQAQVRI